MKPRHRILVALALLGLAGLACKTVERMIFTEPLPAASTPAQPTDEPEPPVKPTAEPVFNDTCPDGGCIEACLDELGVLVNTGHSGNEPRRSSLGQKFSADGEMETLVVYTVLGDKIEQAKKYAAPSRFERYASDSESHQRIWRFYASIIPAEQRSTLQEFHIFSDGEDEILAAVEQSYEDPYRWILMVDIIDSDDPVDLTYTLVHEYAHLLTLGPDQVPPSQAIFNNPESDQVYEDEYESCNTYFPGEGCSKRDSYLNQFVDDFWLDFYDEWVDITYIEDDDEYYDELDSFYRKYEDQFVTDYAATSPEEDIAETFSFFILTPRPTGNSIADQKIIFFYQYPELVSLRMQIIENICGYQ